MSTNRHRNISYLKNSFCSWFCAKNVSFCWITSQNGNRQLNRKLYIIIIDFSWYNVTLLSFNNSFYLIQCFRGIKKNLSKWEMFWKFYIIFRNNNNKSLLRLFNLNKFQNFQIIIINFFRKRIWTNINNIYVGVFHRE